MKFIASRESDNYTFDHFLCSNFALGAFFFDIRLKKTLPRATLEIEVIMVYLSHFI